MLIWFASLDNKLGTMSDHLGFVEKEIETIKALGADNLKLPLDCHHTQISQGDLTEHLKTVSPYIDHVLIAAVPDLDPCNGEINFRVFWPRSAQWAGTDTLERI